MNKEEGRINLKPRVQGNFSGKSAPGATTTTKKPTSLSSFSLVNLRASCTLRSYTHRQKVEMNVHFSTLFISMSVFVSVLYTELIKQVKWKYLNIYCFYLGNNLFTFFLAKAKKSRIGRSMSCWQNQYILNKIHHMNAQNYFSVYISWQIQGKKLQSQEDFNQKKNPDFTSTFSILYYFCLHYNS